MAFIGLGFLGSAILMIYRDVIGIDNNVSEWLDRQIGTGVGLGKSRVSGLSSRLLYAGMALVFAILAYWTLRYGVIEPIGSYALPSASS